MSTRDTFDGDHPIRAGERYADLRALRNFLRWLCTGHLLVRPGGTA